MKTRFCEIVVSGGAILTLTAFASQELTPPSILEEKHVHSENVGTASVIYTPIYGSSTPVSATSGMAVTAPMHPVLMAMPFPVVYSATMALPQPPIERVDPRGFYAGHAFHESNGGWLAPVQPRPRARARQYTFRF